MADPQHWDLLASGGYSISSKAIEIKIRSPQRVITNLVEHYRLSDSQRDNILMAFGAEPENDKYGIANAITRAAQAEEGWEKSVELEWRR